MPVRLISKSLRHYQRKHSETFPTCYRQFLELKKIQNSSLFKYAGHSGAFISRTMESPSTNIANFRLPQIGIRMREVMFKNKVLLKKNYACQEFSTHAYVTDCFQTERLLQKQLLQIMVSSVLNINMV